MINLTDPQLRLWEYPIQNWLKNKPQSLGGEMLMSQPNQNQIRLLNQISILSPTSDGNYPIQNDIKISLLLPSSLNITQVDYFIDNNKITSTKISPFDLAFNPQESAIGIGKHEFKAVIYDQIGNTTTKTVGFTLSQ